MTALADSQHVVDELIEERAAGLRSNPLAWRLVRTCAYPMLGYRAAVRFADRIGALGGIEISRLVSGDLSLRVAADGVEHVPAEGPCVVVANHPGGIADGVAVWDALAARRPDLIYFANRDALRVAPRLDEVIIPVEWREQHRTRAKTRETLKAAAEAFHAGRCVVIFPAGRMAIWSWRSWSLVERPWTSTAVTLARKYGAPVVPLGVQARMSIVYYALALVSEELKNMTLFRELLNKRGARYRLRFGAAIPPSELSVDAEAATARLRGRVHDLAWGG